MSGRVGLMASVASAVTRERERQTLLSASATVAALAKQNGLVFTPLLIPELEFSCEQQPDSLGYQQALPVLPSG